MRNINSSNVATAKICGQLVEACTEAIAWNRRAADSNHRLRQDETDNYHSFLRARLAARKLRDSANRAPCVGVFGPSQAGKSYLVSALSKGKRGSLLVKLGNEEVDFLKKINPGGGRESTGVVTRFSINSPELADLAFPVEIRLLSESDVLKILFNSFFSDFDHAGSMTLPPFSDEEIRERLESIRQLPNGDGGSENIHPEDVLDLKLYLENSYSSLVSNLKSDFWPSAISLAPSLSIQNRARLFSVIWRDFKLFTELYILIASTIEQLRGADVCLAPLSAVVSNSGQPGIVDAQLLSELGKSGGGELAIRPILEGKAESPMMVSKAVLAALTAELRLTISEKSWDFLVDLDILDFPGARSRLKISDPKLVEAEVKSQAAELYLRGKVAYLFQRYTNDQEMSAVLLCVPWGPQEVTGYAPLIDQWVRESNGATREERARVPSGLLMVLTKFDMDLQAKGGDNEITERQRWPDRIRSSLLERFGSMDWVSDWDGKSFRSIFWLRNPEIKDSAYMKYANGVEISINPEHADRIHRLRQYFIEDSLVSIHFEEPGAAWDAAMLAQDGGITKIVSAINNISDPTFRTRNLEDKAIRLLESLHLRLRQYFNEGGDEEVRKKIDIYNIVKKDLTKLIKSKDIWRLLDILNLNLHELRSLYFAVASGIAEVASIGKNGINTADSLGDQDIDDFLEGMISDKVESQPSKTSNGLLTQAHPRAISFADKSIDSWASKLRDLTHDSRIIANLSCTEKSFSLLIEELISAAQRGGLKDKLAILLNPAESNAGVIWEKIVDRQITIAKNVLGDFVSELGMSDLPLDARPGIPPDKPRRHVFEPFQSFPLYRPPLSEIPLAVPMIAARDWLVGLEKVIIDNAGFVGQDTLHADLNRELGRIIAGLNDARAQVK